MLLPDKMIRYKESVIAKFVPLLQILQESQSVEPNYLYKVTKEYFSSISEFIQTLDALYALGSIDFEPTTGDIVCLLR